MCSIIGWHGPIDNKLLRDLFENGAAWGPHAVGLAYIDNNKPFPKLKVFKRAITPTKFLRNCNHRIQRASMANIGLGHTRYATHGGNTDENAHPFNYDDITFIHNGIIHNYKCIRPTAVVDSECLGPLIRQQQLHKAEGSVATLWFEGDELFAYRNSSQRLGATTCTYHDGSQVTLVTTHQSMIRKTTAWSKQWYRVEFIELRSNVAYRIRQGKVDPVWHDCDTTHKESRFVEIDTPAHNYHGG